VTEHDNIMNTHIYKPPRVKESMGHAETLMINAYLFNNFNSIHKRMKVKNQWYSITEQKKDNVRQ
jgi:hypothetical protein